MNCYLSQILLVVGDTITQNNKPFCVIHSDRENKLGLMKFYFDIAMTENKIIKSLAVVFSQV